MYTASGLWPLVCKSRIDLHLVIYSGTSHNGPFPGATTHYIHVHVMDNRYEFAIDLVHYEPLRSRQPPNSL